MKLTGIDCQIPGRQVFNEDVIDMVIHHSRPVYTNNIAELGPLIRKLLATSGIKSRFWRQGDEKPIELLINAVDAALSMSGLQKKDIDLVIYCGIDRGFLEPANANFVAKALQMYSVRSFDVVDACMGWATAVQVANSFLTSPSGINSVLIVNAEFPMDAEGSVLPHNFRIGSKQELKWKSASFTLGEGASACIFQRDANTQLAYEFIEDSQFAEVCSISLPNFGKFTPDENALFYPPLDFYANSNLLFINGRYPGINAMQNLLARLKYKPGIIFPHSVSEQIFRHSTVSPEISSVIFSAYSELGNLATASVPSSVAMALDRKLIKKGEKGIVWIASAGMKFAAFEIQL